MQEKASKQEKIVIDDNKAPKIKAFKTLQEIDPGLLAALAMHKKVFGENQAIAIQALETKEIIYKSGNFQQPRSFRVTLPVRKYRK